MRTLPIRFAPDVVRDSIFPSRMVAVCGDRAWTLGQQMAAEMACDRKQVLYLCGDNRFDPYAVARFAKSQKKNLEEALGCILVARAFTDYQLDELIRRLEPQSAYEIVIISGTCTAFFDEDVTPNDAARLFYRSLWRLAGLSREGLALLLTQSDAPKRSERKHFLNDLCRAADVMIRLENKSAFTLERRNDRPAIART
jgi:hypothetical protein